MIRRKLAALLAALLLAVGLSVGTVAPASAATHGYWTGCYSIPTRIVAGSVVRSQQSCLHHTVYDDGGHYTHRYYRQCVRVVWYYYHCGKWSGYPTYYYT